MDERQFDSLDPAVPAAGTSTTHGQSACWPGRGAALLARRGPGPQRLGAAWLSGTRAIPAGPIASAWRPTPHGLRLERLQQRAELLHLRGEQLRG